MEPSGLEDSNLFESSSQHSGVVLMDGIEELRL